MKNNILKTVLVLALSFTALSFTTTSEKKVDTKDSKIEWVGYKVTGQHAGTIALQEGVLNFSNNKLTGGSFVIDMNSIAVTDIQGEYANKLAGHLKSDDFFGVDNHKTATLKITNVNSNDNTVTVTGDLTIKNITHPITFDMALTENSATAALKIDRTKYDIKYGSASFFDDLKDKAISNEFDLNVNLKF